MRTERSNVNSSKDSTIFSSYDQETRSRDRLVDFSEDENKSRGNWTGRLDFLLSCVGFAVGLGNVWRFPYLCYRNGGGAFLVPYVLMLAFCGLPLFFFELALGQFASRGCLKIWKISPAFKGIGFAMVVVNFITGTYYIVIIAYTIFYFAASFTSTLPWSHCNNTWNTPNCTMESRTFAINLTNSSSTWNGTKDNGLIPTFPSQEYWDNHVLSRSSGIDEIGDIKWQMALCLLLSWIIVFLCLIKGIKSTGKVVYFTAVFPYAVLVILLIRGITLPGSKDGIEFYIVPKWATLKNPKVWGDAAVQIFYSLGPAWGGLITMSSYNRFHNNCYRDAIFVALVNCGTSVFAGFVIFSVIGYMAHELNLPVDEVADSGPGIAFVVYPAGIAMMPIAPLWSILFFFMLFTLGLDSAFAGMETILSALAEESPNYLGKHKRIFTICVCGVMYLLGLVMTTKSGIYWLNLIDFYGGGYSLITIGLTEITVVMYIYGYKRFAKDVQSMLGFQPNIYWIVTWNFLTPAIILFIIIFNALNDTPAKYNDYEYPSWAIVIGFLMMAASVICIPTGVIFRLIKDIRSYKGIKMGSKHFKELLKTMFLPTEDWGPALEQHIQIRQETDNNDGLNSTEGSKSIAKALSNQQIIPKMEKNGGYVNPAWTSHPSDPIVERETYI